MDECLYPPLDLAALTAVLVPLEKYNIVRDAMCRIVWDIVDSNEHQVPVPVELHASDLLRGRSDTVRLSVFSAVAEIVRSNRLSIYRSTYLNSRELSDIFEGDAKLYGLNFFNIQMWLEKHLADRLVVPVMDGIPSQRPNGKKAPRIDGQLIRAFAHNVRYTHHIRQSKTRAQMLSIQNLENLCEPLFADSAHSTLIQLVDIISYMLLQTEKADLDSKTPLSAFQNLILREAGQVEYSYSRSKMTIGN